MKNMSILEPVVQSTDKVFVIEQLPVPTKRMLPTRPFPLKHVHSVFARLQDARQAALALRNAGFDERNIHILESQDYMEAVSQGHSPLGFLTSMDYDVYLSEANQGRSFLVVRPTGYAQLEQIRSLLAPHRARLARYIDTWTMSELLP